MKILIYSELLLLYHTHTRTHTDHQLLAVSFSFYVAIKTNDVDSDLPLISGQIFMTVSFVRLRTPCLCVCRYLFIIGDKADQTHG